MATKSKSKRPKRPTKAKARKPEKERPERVIMGLPWDRTTYDKLGEYRQKHGHRSIQEVVRFAARKLLGMPEPVKS